jgi:hypothetical protein
MGMYRKRSNVKNWKIKEYIQGNGNTYYTVWFKSIFGWWRSLRTPPSYMDESSSRTVFKNKQLAKEAIVSEISHNLALDSSKVVKVKEIKF